MSVTYTLRIHTIPVNTTYNNTKALPPLKFRKRKILKLCIAVNGGLVVEH